MSKASSLPQQLRNHAVDDHLRSCSVRHTRCDCGYDDRTSQLLRQAATRIDELEKVEKAKGST